MNEKYLKFTEEDFGQVCFLLDQIIEKSNDVILGRGGAGLMEIRSLAIDAQNQLKNVVIVINNDVA